MSGRRSLHEPGLPGGWESRTWTKSLRRVTLWKGRMRKEDRGSPRHLGSSSSCVISSRKAAFSWLGTKARELVSGSPPTAW